MSHRLLFLSCILSVLALTLAACGGGSSSGSSGDESQIEAAIEKSAGSDPAACTKLQTQKFTEQTTQETGDDAVHVCEKEARKEEGVESARVSNVDAGDSTATAEATLKGGTLDGQTVEVELVKDGDRWKLDELVKFTEFDQAKLIEALKRELPRIAIGFSPSVESCVIKSLEGASQTEAEEAVLKGSGGALERAAVVCSLKS